MFFILIHWLASYPHDTIKQILLWWFSNFENDYLPIQQIFIADYQRAKGFPCETPDKESACNAGDLGSIPGLGRSPGEGKGYPLQYSGLENSMDCIVYGFAKSQTKLSDFHFTIKEQRAFQVALVVKNPAANAGAMDSIAGLGRCSGGGEGNPLQYSCLEKPRHRGAWWTTVHGVT